VRGENLRINRRKKKIEDSGKMEIERLTDGEEEEGISFLKESKKKKKKTEMEIKQSSGTSY
jgi:hypothetical protein